MKLYKKLKKIGILLIALLTLSTLSTELFAGKIERSCNADYYAMLKSFGYEDENGDRRGINIPYGKYRVELEGERFSAKAKCGKLVPKQCRKRARDKLIECAWSSVSNPSQETSFSTCRQDKGIMYGYTLQTKLMEIVKEQVCTRPLRVFSYPNTNFNWEEKGSLDVVKNLPETYTIKFTLGIKTHGKDGCGSKNPGTFTTRDGIRYGRKVQASNDRFLLTPLKEFTVTCP